MQTDRNSKETPNAKPFVQTTFTRFLSHCSFAVYKRSETCLIFANSGNTRVKRNLSLVIVTWLPRSLSSLLTFFFRGLIPVLFWPSGPLLLPYLSSESSLSRPALHGNDSCKLSCGGSGCIRTSLMFMYVVHAHEKCIKILRTWNRKVRFAKYRIMVKDCSHT